MLHVVSEALDLVGVERAKLFVEGGKDRVRILYLLVKLGLGVVYFLHRLIIHCRRHNLFDVRGCPFPLLEVFADKLTLH